MKKSPFKSKKRNEISRELIDRAFVIAIDDELTVTIKELKKRAIILLPEQLPEILKNKDVFDSLLIEKILSVLKQQ